MAIGFFEENSPIIMTTQLTRLKIMRRMCVGGLAGYFNGSHQYSPEPSLLSHAKSSLRKVWQNI